MSLDIKEKCYTRINGDYNLKERETRHLWDKLDREMKSANCEHMEEIEKVQQRFKDELKKVDDQIKQFENSKWQSTLNLASLEKTLIEKASDL